MKPSNKKYMVKKSLLAVLVISAILSSCSKYDKLLKSSDYNLKYTKALEYYEKKDHYRSATLLEQLVSVYKGTQRADTIEFYLANGYFHQGDYLLANHYFDKFRRNYPRSIFTEEAEFMYAYCYYKSSPRPLLDQETTNMALASFLEFSAKYPRTSHKKEVDTIMDELRNKLVEKSHISAKLYFDIGDYKAAIVSLKNSLQDYPNSSYREEQLFMVLQASYLLAENSVPSKRRERFQNTIDDYFSLIGEYPKTKYLKDAEKIYSNSIKVTGNQ
jgi:outer membrane protein assembly factor BamD